MGNRPRIPILAAQLLSTDGFRIQSANRCWNKFSGFDSITDIVYVHYLTREGCICVCISVIKTKCGYVIEAMFNRDVDCMLTQRHEFLRNWLIESKCPQRN